MKAIKGNKNMAIENYDEAVEIVEDVCGYFLGEDNYKVVLDQEKACLKVTDQSGNGYAWNLKEKNLTDVLVYLDCHTFCALVIREEQRHGTRILRKPAVKVSRSRIKQIRRAVKDVMKLHQ